MGLRWRLLAPKPLKKARRTARRAEHPVGAASWALASKPVQQARRAAFKVAHPVEAAEFAAQNAVGHAARGGKHRRRAQTARSPAAAPSTSTAAATPGPMEVTWLPGSHEIPVAGPEHHAAAVRETLAAIAAGAEPDAALLPEPSNPHDPNAVAVHMAGGLVGYIPRRTAAVLQPALIAHSASYGGRPNGCPARIVAGRPPQVVLTIDLAELGVDAAALR